MNERFSAPGVERRRCTYAWCVTEHGATVHPDDEVHRSAGRSLTVRARRSDAEGTGQETELEIGALRRAGDAETWIVIETGIGASLALTREGARLLGRQLRAELRSGGALASDGVDG